MHHPQKKLFLLKFQEIYFRVLECAWLKETLNNVLIKIQ
jgi:hypothetical protein